jgi:formate C-acetyltransferase
MHNRERMQLLKAHLRERPAGVWAEPFHEAWLAAEGDPLPLRLARAQAAEMAAARPFVKPGELIVGNDALAPVVTSRASAFSPGIVLHGDRLSELRQSHPERRAELDAIESYWKGWFAENRYEPPMLMHAALDYGRFLEMGVDGLRRYVEGWKAKNAAARPECAPWYDALLVTLDGVAGFAEAHARAAGEAAAAEPAGACRDELRRVADACRHAAHGAPRSFREAAQLFYLVFWLCGHDSPGPIDRYLYPALKRDLERGAITMDEAQEIVDCLWLKFAEKTAYGATLGGQLADGRDACNELTALCLRAIGELRLLSPRTAFRWHPDVSREAFREACEVAAGGAGFPAFVNDNAMVASMVERGIALPHAREYSFVGCGQTYPYGRGHGNYEDVVINSAKALEQALNNGVDPVTGRPAGPQTGEAESFGSFEAFRAAWRRQAEHEIAENVRRVNEYRARNRDRWFALLRSMVTWSCVERGLDWHAGGADYSEGMIDMVGLTTVTDSLLAVRQAVYQERLLSLPELRDVLRRNWAGAEPLRQIMLHKAPKFGNDDPEADVLTAEEVRHLNDFIRSHRTVFGGPWGMDVIGWSGAVIYGEQTGATPDGRRTGQPVADCAGPAQGRNVCGLTPTLRSVLKLPHDRSHGPLALSLRFPRQSVRGPEGADRLRALIETYFAAGGQQLQISIASTEQMAAAQRDPEAHADLIVRVGGFSAYFTQLEKRFQDDMIARSEMGL